MISNKHSAIVVVALCISLFYGESRSGDYVDFSGGLNTASNRFQVKDNESVECTDLVLDNPDGGLRIRPGYHAVTSNLASHSKIWDIHSYKSTEGEPVLFQKIERDADDWCDLYVSDPYTYAIADSLWSYLYPNHGTWLTWNGNQYYFNGRNLDMIIAGPPDQWNAKELYPPAPGQLVANPIATTGNLDGWYIYALVAGCNALDYNKRPSAFSRPVLTNSEQVRLHNFYPHLPDSNGCNDSAATDYFIVRTRGNSININTDSLWIIDSILNVRWDTTFDASFTDNYSDAGVCIPANFYRTLVPMDTGLFQSQNDWNESGWMIDIDGDGSYRLSVGAPTEWLVNSGSVTDTLSTPGVDTHVKVFLYAVAYIDTVTGMVGDTGIVCGMNHGGWNSITLTSIEIRLPPTPRPEWARLIIRATTQQTMPLSMIEKYDLTWYAIDTVYEDTAKTYRDINNPAEVAAAYTPHEFKVPYERMKGGLVHESKMYLWSDHYLYYSTTDTANFRILDNVHFDLDDADRIIGVASFEGYLVIYKTKSIWILYTQDGEVYDRSKRSYGYGLISPHSFGRLSGANVYLGIDGVLVEVDSRYRSNTIRRDFQSDRIKDILLRAGEDMTDAAAGVVDNRYLLSYPGSDSVFVYFGQVDAWGIWSFDFFQAALYDTLKREDYAGFHDLIFIQDDDERVFLLDEADSLDDGSSFTASWRKDGEGLLEPGQKILEQTELYTEEMSADDTSSVIYTAFSQQDDSLGTIDFDTLPTVFQREFFAADGGNVTARWFNHRLQFGSHIRGIISGLRTITAPAGMSK